MHYILCGPWFSSLFMSSLLLSPCPSMCSELTTVGLSAWMGRCSGTWKARNHTAWRGSLLSRGSVAPWGGDLPLTKGAQGPQSALSLCFSSFPYCLSSSDERITPGSKFHKRDLLEGLRCGGTNPGLAAYAPGREQTEESTMLL